MRQPASGSYALVQLRTFIEATRDSGYKNGAYAIAELVDNAIEAGASAVDLVITNTHAESSSRLEVSIIDNGCGMDGDTVPLALQFGGSTRFRSRTGFGRFGMGLPNSSLSQARRVDVTSWTSPGQAWTTYLDIDEIYRNQLTCIPAPKRTNMSVRTPTGTVITLSKCDRLQYRSIAEAETHLRREYGRMFRHFLLSGLSISINGLQLRPVDPLFVRGITSGPRGLLYGPPLEYPIRIAEPQKTAIVRVSFSELPLREWRVLSNQDKNRLGIAKGAGVSILRGGREIDHGWFFMDSKRKENYDDWWRCEITFDPELDDLFGVTHTKQGIHPVEQLVALLSPDISRIARELNARVRKQFAEIRAHESRSIKLPKPHKRDHLLEPPSSVALRMQSRSKQKSQSGNGSNCRIAISQLAGLRYAIEQQKNTGRSFYEVHFEGNEITVILNESHPFYEQIYRKIPSTVSHREKPVIDNVRAMLAAAARAEVAIEKRAHREIILKFRESWSNALVAFLA